MLLGRTCLKNFVVFTALLVAGLLYAPPHDEMRQYKIKASDIQFRKATPDITETRFETAPTEGTLDQQFYKRQNERRRFHYKFDEAFPINGPRSLYIPDASGPFRISVSGGYAGVAKPHDFFAPSFGSHWKIFDIPRYFLIPGQNRLDVFLFQDETRSGLREVYFGPTEIIRRGMYKQQKWMDRTPQIARIGFGLSLVICMSAMLIGLRNPSFIMTGGLSIFFLFQAFYPLIKDTQILPDGEYSIRLALPVIGLIALSLSYIFRLQRKTALGELLPAFSAFALMGPLLAILTLFSPLFLDAQMLIASLVLIGALPLTIALSLYDLSDGVLQRRSRIQELSLKVSQQSEELDEKTKLIIKEMRQRALMEERQRFTRDIHDGIGGKLLSLLLQVRTGEMNRDVIAAEVQSSIRDLRMVVDSIDHMGEDLNVIFETFKARAVPQLKVANLDLIWQQKTPIIGALTHEGGETLHLYRLMQEALTNSIKHARASKITITISQPDDQSRLDLVICDDGIGMKDRSSNQIGNGLKNMRVRAQALGAQMKIGVGDNQKGVKISLSVELQSPAI